MRSLCAVKWRWNELLFLKKKCVAFRAAWIRRSDIHTMGVAMGWGRDGRETLVRVGYELNSAGMDGGGQSLGASYQVRLQSVHERDKAATGQT